MVHIVNKKLILGEQKNTKAFSTCLELTESSLEKRLGLSYLILEAHVEPETAEKITDILRDVFQNEYYKKDSHANTIGNVSIGSMFEHAISRVNKALHALLAEGYLKADTTLNACIIGIKNTEIHLVSTGKAKAYLIRNDSMLELTEEDTKMSGKKYFSHIISGAVEIGDVLFFSTPEFLNFVSTEKIKRTLKTKTLDEAREELKELIEDTDFSAPIASLFLEVKSNIKPVSEAKQTPFLPPEREKQKPYTYPSLGDDKASTNDLPEHEHAKDGKDPLAAAKKSASIITAKIKDTFSLKPSKKRSVETGLKPVSTDLSTKKYTDPATGTEPASPAKKIASGVAKKATSFLPDRNKQKTYIFLAIVLIIIFLVAVTYFIFARKEKSQTEIQTNYISEIQEKEKKAADAIIYRDYDQAEKLLNDATEIINTQLDEEQKISSEIKSLESKISEHYDTVNRIQRITPEKVASFGGNAYETLMGSKDTLYSSSNKDIGVYRFIPESKKFEEFSQKVEGITKLALGTFNDQKNTVVFLTPNGIAEMAVFSRHLKKLASEFPESNHNFVDMAVYSDKIYLLDTANNQIYRMVRTVDGYSVAKEWVTDESVSLQDATSLAIDSNVYVLKKNGTILKFLSGQVEPFTMDELQSPLSEDTVLFTSSDVENLYILDKEHNTVIEITKKGKVVNQFVMSLDSTPKDIYVDPDSKKIYVLTEDGLYTVSK
ncbi:hypothetical protein KKH43_06335 [Patescibacteria group bacterium]|nr:hypothetical protein [Patescibacteria group bacterium]